MSLSFSGGLHIRNFKKPVCSFETKPLMPCREHIYPVTQHIGAPLKVLVKPGDTVKVGEKIADAEEYTAVPVHSSVSGTVTKIEKHIHPSGSIIESVFVENDMLYTPIDGAEPIKIIDSRSKRELLWIIREAGIVGLGGAGFPAHIKLDTDKKIKFLIINGAECEPYITADHRRMVENTDDVIFGIKVVMKILGLDTSYIGIETNKRECIDLMKQHLRYDKSVNIMPLKPKYPQGAEKMLIKAITGKSVPSGGLPADVGAVVFNVETVYEIGHVFKTGMPLTERIVTVSGDAVKEPSNFRVPLGVPISFLFESAGGFVKEPQKIVMGGPMMGAAQYSTDVPVVKTTSSVLAFSKADRAYNAEAPCIRCGKCVSHCPMHLMPNMLSTFAAKNDADSAEKYHILDCMQCGMCSYVCPARKNPLGAIRIMRPIVMKNIRSRKEAAEK